MSEPLELDLRASEAGVTLRVRVQPRAAQDRVAGARQGALLVRLSAPPVEGAANAALARVIGEAVGLPPSRVRLVRGQGGRDKLLLLTGIGDAAVRERLALAIREPRR